MLLLDRPKGTSVILVVNGEQIKVTVVGFSEFGAKLGFEADRDKVKIAREEVFDINKL